MMAVYQSMIYVIEIIMVVPLSQYVIINQVCNLHNDVYAIGMVMNSFYRRDVMLNFFVSTGRDA
jgi:hypothetical protein